MKKEEVKIYYYYGQGGDRCYTPSVEYAHARADYFGSSVFYETYTVEVPEEKK